jgi:hypothetical protein
MSNIFVGDSGMATEHDFGTSCLNDFVQELADEITGSCMIPMHLPAAEVENIVKRARKWFYKKYEYSVQENFFVIPSSAFKSDYFKASRTINMPEGVYSIFGVHKTNANSLSGDINFTSGDFSVERMFAGSMYGDAGVASAAESLEYYVVNQKFFDLARQILNNPYSFDYNRLKRSLRFTGETPTTDIILEVYETIPDCALYEDEIFFRYCAAKIKISLGSKLSIFEFQLPGNISVNADAIQSLGESELESVIEEINEDEGTDWMMHS